MGDTPKGYTEIKVFAKDDCEACGGDGFRGITLFHPPVSVIGEHEINGFCLCVIAVRVGRDD